MLKLSKQFYFKNNNKFKAILNLLLILNLNLSIFCKEFIIYKNDLCIVLANNSYLSIVLFFLKTHFKLQFKELVDICAVDYYNNTKNNRFVLNYTLLSLKYKTRIRLKVSCDALQGVLSSTQNFASAGWLEREVWDTFGVYFKNHFDLRRILTDYGFEGFPFRKDFPLSGYVELRYDSEKRIVIYDLLELTQEFRFFEFINPWAWRVN